MSRQPGPRITPAEYLEAERQVETRNEYYDGEVFALRREPKARPHRDQPDRVPGRTTQGATVRGVPGELARESRVQRTLQRIRTLPWCVANRPWKISISTLC